MDQDSIADIIKTCNVIKNEKVQAAKRKVKGEAQKAKAKRDKQKELEAQKKQAELFGDSNQYDEYDQIGEDYEDASLYVISFANSSSSDDRADADAVVVVM